VEGAESPMLDTAESSFSSHGVGERRSQFR
jgi:hypothetical protein